MNENFSAHKWNFLSFASLSLQFIIDTFISIYNIILTEFNFFNRKNQIFSNFMKEMLEELKTFARLLDCFQKLRIVLRY